MIDWHSRAQTFQSCFVEKRRAVSKWEPLYFRHDPNIQELDEQLTVLHERRILVEDIATEAATAVCLTGVRGESGD